MSFKPSEHSYAYSGWYEDARAYAQSKYDTAVDTALAPVRAAQDAKRDAEAAVDKATQAAADLRAATEAARDTAGSAASMVPWGVGGIVLVGGMYLYSKKGGGRMSNPLDGKTAARWLLLGGTIAGATGAALTTAGAATLQPEVLLLSGPLMVTGAALIGASAAAKTFDESGRS